MRKRIIGLVKFALVALLFAWVFSSVQWRDVRTRSDASGQVVERVEGEILGPWDAEQVRFATADGERTIAIGPTDDGGTIAVTPGLLTYFVHLDRLWFAIGALCYVFTLVASSVRWWWLLRVNDLAVGIGEALRYTWIGVFFNNVVPGQTGGDLFKALYIVKRCPDGRVPALMSVVVDRILGLGSLALLGAVVVMFQFDRFGTLAIGIWGVLALDAMIGVVAISRRIRRLVRLDQVLRRLPARFASSMMKVDEAIFFYRRHKFGIGVWFVVGSLNHAVTIVSFWAMGNAIGVGLPAVDYFALIPVILIVSAVPLAPNGWGVGEALFGTLFAKFGAGSLVGLVPDPAQVMRTRGVALSVLYRLHTTIWSLVGGAMLLLDRDRVTQAEIDAEVAREELEDEARVPVGGGVGER